MELRDVEASMPRGREATCDLPPGAGSPSAPEISAGGGGAVTPESEEECEAVEAAEGEGVEGEGVEKRRREGEESTAKSGSVSLGRSRSSTRRLPPAIDEEEVEDAEEDEE